MRSRWGKTWLASVVVAGLVSGLMLGSGAPASAVTVVRTFEAIDSVAVGCQGVRIDAIRQSVGVTYFAGSQRLSFPTATLPYDERGRVELRAVADAGYTASRTTTYLGAPDECRTALSPDSGWVDYNPRVSWCSTDSHPTLDQFFLVPEGTRATWRLVSKATKATLASGERTFDSTFLGTFEVAVPLGLPLGAYWLEFRNADSPTTLFPYVYDVAQYVCVTAKAKDCTTASFTNAPGQPDADVTFPTVIEEPSGQPASIIVPAGTTVDYTSPTKDLYWEAFPTGAGVVGNLDSGGVTLPACALTATPRPTVTGTVKVGSTLTATIGPWQPAPVTLAYQWLRNGAAIPGATGLSHILTAAEEGKYVSLRVTGSKSGYPKTVVYSFDTPKVKPGSLTATPKPQISGVTRVGQTLTVSAGSWQPAPVALGYQWLRNGSAIAGATGLSYRPTSADLGTYLSVRVVGSKAGYASATQVSYDTPKIKPAA